MEKDIWKNKIIDYIKRNRVSTTEVADCLGKSGVLSGVQSISEGCYRVGEVKWVYGIDESNWSVHEQIQDAGEGQVVFIETINCGNRAIIGELVAKYLLIYKQIAAIVSNSPFRDINSLLKEKYAIWCNGFSPIGCFNEQRNDEQYTNWICDHKKEYDGTIAVCDDSGVVIIPKSCLNKEFYDKLIFIEKQEDIWFDCLDRLKWSTYDIVCKKKYLEKGEFL